MPATLNSTRILIFAKGRQQTRYDSIFKKVYIFTDFLNQKIGHDMEDPFCTKDSDFFTQYSRKRDF